ncbi:TauD/TfdA family dioxygenase [Roseivivax sp. THAF197b]|uniref:TauD/TfdA family dioxygenase n=1 Tax=Roseivivax sp. THAF197b TaxID=2588299 RepID=UPI0012684F42|nr:TauD/TfdA family dioxygenase [Roseivivax sp. THAF197b]QFS81378.1 Gamma-butyrobetaine dioxygenase [Roseivivax sp. THAF197b]
MTQDLTTGADSLELRHADGRVARFPYLWLRDADPAGFHPETQERLFDLTQVPLDTAPDDARIEEGMLRIDWPDQDAPSLFGLDWLWAHRPGQARHDPAHIPFAPWPEERTAQNIQRFDAEAIATSDAALRDWLVAGKRDGLTIVEGLADSVDAGLAIARRAGFLRETNFGVTFEVVSKPNPNNLAYTADALPLHTDLTNQDLPPGYQFLHCLANEAEGGGSVFCDGIAVANALYAEDPAAFETLARVSVPFRFHDGETDIRSRKCVISLAEDGTASEICFNAHLADLLDLPPEEMPDYYRAYRRFMQLCRDPARAVTLKLQAGEMVVFDNRRILHGREAFDPATGFRHLHGCYVDRGEWDSRIRIMDRDAP